MLVSGLIVDFFKRGDVNSNWDQSFSSATKYCIFVLRYFLPKQTVYTLMKCRMMAFHQVTSVKSMYRKIYFTIEMQPNIFF